MPTRSAVRDCVQVEVGYYHPGITCLSYYMSYYRSYYTPYYMCYYRWDTLIQELHACRAPGMQCANGTVVTSTCIIAIEAMAIGALLFYACNMRKKVIRNNQFLMARALGEQNS